MNVTVEDYEKALDGFLEDVRGMGDEVVSTLLCGSMVRQDVLPGKSDIMDAYLFLRPEVFKDRERFMSALEKMVAASVRLLQSGLPVHPFIYWSELNPIPAATLESLKSERESKIVTGDDVRSALDCARASRLAMRSSFFEARRKGYRLMAYLHKEELTSQECRIILGSLVQLQKYLPKMACHALGMWPTQHIARHDLQRALPEIDAEVLDKIEELRARPEDAVTARELHEVLREALVYVENLNDVIIATLKDRNEI